jgi:hypothetical protein
MRQKTYEELLGEEDARLRSWEGRLGRQAVFLLLWAVANVFATAFNALLAYWLLRRL